MSRPTREQTNAPRRICLAEDLIAAGEGVHVEFKRQPPAMEKLARECCALANSGGGVLIIGVADDGEVCGTDLSAAEARGLAERVCELLRPAPRITVERPRLHGARLVLFRVHAATGGPCSVDTPSGSRVLVRVGDSNRDASSLTRKTLGRKSSKRARGLPPRLTRLLHAQGRCTAAEFARAANISERRARRLLVRLVQEGRLVSIKEGPHEYFA